MKDGLEYPGLKDGLEYPGLKDGLEYPGLNDGLEYRIEGWVGISRNFLLIQKICIIINKCKKCWIWQKYFVGLESPECNENCSIKYHYTIIRVLGREIILVMYYTTTAKHGQPFQTKLGRDSSWLLNLGLIPFWSGVL